jgi:TonB family protein
LVARAALVAALAGPLGSEPSHARETFEEALIWFQRGNNEAFERFGRLAKRGDRRAQYLAGLMLIEGNGVPVDRVRGYSWLQISAQGYPGSYGESRENYAEQAVLSRGSALSGQELIQAEKATQAFLLEKFTAIEALKAQGRRELLGEVWVDDDRMISGCALDRTSRGCSKAPDAAPTRPSCVGTIPETDSRPTADDVSARIVRPDYPWSAAKIAWEGVVIGLAHVDWTGEVCRVTMLMGSGLPAIDKAALEALSKWRLKPAVAGGEPAESLYDVSLGFGIKEYNLQMKFSPTPDREPSDLSPKKGTRLPSN